MQEILRTVNYCLALHLIKDTSVTTLDSRVPPGVSFESQCHKLIITVSDVFEQFRRHSENLLLLLALAYCGLLLSQIYQKSLSSALNIGSYLFPEKCLKSHSFTDQW